MSSRKGRSCMHSYVVSAPGSRYGRFASGHERTSSSQRLLWYSQVLSMWMVFNPNYKYPTSLCAIWPNLTQPCTGDVCRIGHTGKWNADKGVFLTPGKAARVVFGFKTFCGFNFCVLIFAENFCDTWKVWRLLQQDQEWEADPPGASSALLSLQSEKRIMKYRKN